MPRVKPPTSDSVEADPVTHRPYAIVNAAVLMELVPGMHDAMHQMWRAVMGGNQAPTELKWLLGHMASKSAGCRYCSAHTGYLAVQWSGVDDKKVADVWDFETSPRFTDAERAALRIAVAAGRVPNETTDEMFDELHKYFDDGAIAEMVGIIAIYGFMNRWNDTLMPELEATPYEFALAHGTLP